MAPGTLLIASLLLVAGQAPTDVAYFNHRNLRIPIGMHPAKREQIKQLLLFVSSDQGKTWHQEAVVPPDNDEFLFYAPADGVYWLRVAFVNKQGKQEPEDITKGPPDQKVLIDTLKPMVRFASTHREGDGIAVAWEVQEEHPDLPSLKLEYRPADGSPAQWSAVSVTQALIGQAQVRPGTPGAVVLRLQFKDLAGNLSFQETEVPGVDGVVRASVKPNPVEELAPPPQPYSGPPVDLKSPPLPVPDVKPAPVAAMAEHAPVTGGQPASPAVVPPPVSWGEMQHQAASSNQFPTPPVVPPAPVLPPVVTPPADSGVRVVARSDATRSPVSPPSQTPAAPVEPAHKKLPTARLVNKTEVVLEYQLDKVGPSGIGSVELWLTQTDGQTWQRWAEDPDAKTLVTGGKVQRTVELPGEGIYGFRLVVKSRAGRGRPSPNSGDLPEMRIEVDTTAPEAVLLEPRPDAEHRDALVLQWKVKDRNLDAKPITIEWSDRPDGTWHTIVANHPNTPEGYTWQVPHEMPVSVYLRLRVRDAAGNEGIAVTDQPQVVDLSEPEGHLLDVSIAPRHP